MNAGASKGAAPTTIAVSARAIVTVGFAKEVEEGNLSAHLGQASRMGSF
jgi:hypothetical protein